jgi:hypothetical protein
MLLVFMAEAPESHGLAIRPHTTLESLATAVQLRYATELRGQVEDGYARLESLCAAPLQDRTGPSQLPALRARDPHVSG